MTNVVLCRWTKIKQLLTGDEVKWRVSEERSWSFVVCRQFCNQMSGASVSLYTWLQHVALVGRRLTHVSASGTTSRRSVPFVSPSTPLRRHRRLRCTTDDHGVTLYLKLPHRVLEVDWLTVQPLLNAVWDRTFSHWFWFRSWFLVFFKSPFWSDFWYMYIRGTTQCTHSFLHDT